MDEELLITLQPIVESVGLELVDVERRPGVLAVTVDRQGGVDLDALTTANRAVSRALDELDPIPGRYSLEVSSPGLERPLRTPAHFARAVGETITVKTRPQVTGERRRRGRLVAADDEGFELDPEPTEDAAGSDGATTADGSAGIGTVRLSYRDVDRARTVFEWGSANAGERRTSGRGPEGAGDPAAKKPGPGGQKRAERAERETGRQPMSKTNFEFLDALGQIARDKGISVDTLLDALANALVAAYKRRPDAAEEAVVTIDPESGEIRVYGQELDDEGNVTREWDDTPDDFGRIAAQTAKQVILQRIREVERDLKYEEYAGREGDIVTGIVQQTDNRYTLLDLGKVEALLPQAEQVSYERYEHGARLKAYIVEVRKTTKGPQIVVSRSHPGLIKRLFELEVPEISSGAVEIKACAREPGHRTKIAVWSNDPNVDPVGACVGARGSRVRMVTNELRGERVDVVPFSDDPIELIQSALAPARVREVRLDDETGTATVIVSDYQLSLAIGKEGQNARLAARLTGWRIDIKSETQLADEESGYAGEEWAEGEWVQNEAGEMVWQPAEGGTAVSAAEWSQGAEAGESAVEAAVEAAVEEAVVEAVEEVVEEVVEAVEEIVEAVESAVEEAVEDVAFEEAAAEEVAEDIVEGTVTDRADAETAEAGGGDGPA